MVLGDVDVGSWKNRVVILPKSLGIQNNLRYIVNYLVVNIAWVFGYSI